MKDGENKRDKVNLSPADLLCIQNKEIADMKPQDNFTGCFVMV